MPNSDAEDAIDVLDERKVAALNDILLELFAMIERYFLGVLQESGMGEAELSFESRCACQFGNADT
jgi:hypothetical protein